MLDKARPATKPILEAIAKPFLSLHPNLITFIGFLFGILYLYLMSQQLYGWALLCFLGVSIDALDGTIARLTDKVTDFGAFFDSTLDRFTDALMIISFAATGLISWELATLVVLLSLMISYTRAKAEQMGNNKFKLAVGIIERPERLIAFLIATLLAYLDFNPIYFEYTLIQWIFILLSVLSLITVLQRMYVAYLKLR